MKKLILITALIATVASTGALAQDNMTAIHYDVSVPLEDMKDFVDNTSWRGVGFDLRQYTRSKANIMIGFAFGWQVFDYKTSELVVLERGAIKGNQRRYINSFPIFLTAHYYIGKRRSTRFFIGGGAGTQFIIQRFEIGVLALQEKNWHLAVAPEVGMQFPFGNQELFIAAKYHYAFASGEAVVGDSIDYTYLNISLGFSYSRW